MEMEVHELEKRILLADCTHDERVKKALLTVSQKNFNLYFSSWEKVLTGQEKPNDYVTGIENDPMFELIKSQF